MHSQDSRPAPRDEVLFDIEMALRKEEKLWPKRYRPGDHNRFRPLARGILEYLELCGLRFARRPPAPGHSTPDFLGRGRNREEKRLKLLQCRFRHSCRNRSC